MKAAPKILPLALLFASSLPLAAADETKPPQPPRAAAAPAPATGKESQEDGLRVVTGAEVPSYFVVAAFLRRAQIVMERPLEQRPDNFARFGCGPGDPRFEPCATLIKKAAEVYARQIDPEKSPVEKQQEHDRKGKEIGELYGQLLRLVGKTPEEAAAFHRWIEEVRITVGVGVSDEPGNDLMESARCFDRALEASYPEARKLPGYVPAPAGKAS